MSNVTGVLKPLIKVTAFMRRLPSMTREEFIAYHRHNHAPTFMGIAASQKHVVRYIQSHPLPIEIAGLPATTYDGLTEIWFKDMAGFEAVFTDAEYMEVVRPDEMRFVDFERSEMFLTEEYAVRE